MNYQYNITVHRNEKSNRIFNKKRLDALTLSFFLLESQGNSINTSYVPSRFLDQEPEFMNISHTSSSTIR